MGERYERHWGTGAIVVGVLAVLVSGWYVLAEGQGAALWAYTALFGAATLTMSAGAFFVGGSPRRIYLVACYSGLLFFPSVFGPWVTWQAGPFTFSDVFLLCGYSSIISFAMLISRVSVGRHAWIAEFDAGAACVGVVLYTWIFLLAPMADAGTPEIAGALYALLDVLLAVALSHLAWSLQRLPPSLRWLVAGALLLLAVDVIDMVLTFRFGMSGDLLVDVGHLAGFLALAAALSHPSLPELTPPHESAPPPWGSMGTALFVVVVPVFVAVFMPSHGMTDRLMRTGLVVLILALLLSRLGYTMRALADAESESRYRAARDPLTGLHNRAAIIEAVGERLSLDAARRRHTVLLFLDCDDFKNVNDTWGHHAGDTLLIGLAERLAAVIGPTDLAARHGGDEFVVLSSVDDVEDVHRLCATVRSIFDEPLRILPDRTHPLVSSIGAALAAPREGCSTEELLRRADAAMYEAKSRGSGSAVVFDDTLADRIDRQARLGDRLGRAVEDESFDVVYQPIMGGLGYGTLLGWEALARWEDVELGEVAPEVFVSVAEDVGLVGALGEIVLRRACDALLDLRAENSDVFVAVNVSPSQLEDPDFVDVVIGTLAAAGLPPEALRLELTESVLVTETHHAFRTLARLRDAGIRVYIDDFGTGYASLTTLLRWPLDGVKLDKTLVESIAHDVSARRRLTAVMALVRSLDISEMIAEGVETVAQGDVLMALGCPAVQGWLYGHPASAGEADRELVCHSEDASA